MADSLYGVTGATGGLGGRVARRLADRGVAQRLVVRDPQRAPALSRAEVAAASFRDADAMRRAVAGVDTLLLIPAHEAADRAAEHTTAVDAAIEAGVRRIVYISFLATAADATFTFSRDHWATEEHIRSTGVAHTFLRMSLYLDVVPIMVGDDGAIRGPAGDGRVAWIARDDLADVAVAVLTGAGHDGRTYDVTGPRAVTMEETVAELSRVVGRDITYEAETLDEARASRAQYGAPAWEVDGWITSYAAIATGELAIVSDTVAALAGHEPFSVLDFFRANPDSWDRLRA